MKPTIFLIACASVLASCNKGPEVDLKNASGNAVTKAVRQSGVMTEGAMVEPGLWESKVTVHEMNIPGMPPEFAQKMKETMAQHQPDASRSCLTPEEVKRPKEDFFGAWTCQVLPLTRLGEGARALDAPTDKFRDWQENTNSIFCEDHSLV